MRTARKKPKPKVFRQTQKELDTLIDYQLKDLDFWPKMIRKRARALKKTFNESFDGEVSQNTVKYFQYIQKDINEISKKFKDIHSLLGDIMSEHDTDKTAAWRDERWKLAASRSFDVLDEETGEILAEALPERILRAWLRQNSRGIRVLNESAPSGIRPGTVHIEVVGPYKDLPVGRGGKQYQRGQQPDRFSPDPEELKERIEERLPYRVIQKWWAKQDQRLEVEEDNVRKRQEALEAAFDWEGHAKDFVGDFKRDLQRGADPSWFMTDLAKAMKDDDPDGALKRLSVSAVADRLYGAVLKEMKRQKVPVL